MLVFRSWLDSRLFPGAIDSCELSRFVLGIFAVVIGVWFEYGVALAERGGVAEPILLREGVWLRCFFNLLAELVSPLSGLLRSEVTGSDWFRLTARRLVAGERVGVAELFVVVRRRSFARSDFTLEGVPFTSLTTCPFSWRSMMKCWRWN